MQNYQELYRETRKLSVLLVEDFQPLLQEMQLLFEDLFETVVCARNGEEALQYYVHHSSVKPLFDIVITDIHMPVMNGVELAKKIKSYNNEQVLIVLSAYSEKEYLLELINIGISKFITKPIEHDALFDILLRESKQINSKSLVMHTQNIVNLGDGYSWNKDARILKCNHNTIALTKHELLLLEFFVSKTEHVYTNKEITHMFYAHNIDMSEKNIRNLVFKLRKKIPQQCVQNIYGLGYKFIVPLQ